MVSWVGLLLRDTKAVVAVRGAVSQPASWQAGVRQGCPLSPLLYLFPADALARWLGPGAPIIRHQGGASANISVLESEARIPWSGHTGRHNIREVYRAIKAAKMSLVFVNTRSRRR